MTKVLFYIRFFLSGIIQAAEPVKAAALAAAVVALENGPLVQKLMGAGVAAAFVRDWLAGLPSSAAKAWAVKDAERKAAKQAPSPA